MYIHYVCNVDLREQEIIYLSVSFVCISSSFSHGSLCHHMFCRSISFKLHFGSGRAGDQQVCEGAPCQ